MLQTKHTSIAIRPRQPLQWLATLGFVALGVILAKKIYGPGAWLFAVAYCLLAFGFLRDRIVFDGTKLRRLGYGAWLLEKVGVARELALDDIEAVVSYAAPGGRSGLRFQTVIRSEHLCWHLTSSAAQYAPFVKAFFRAVNPHVLDTLSTELLLYWRTEEPPYKPATTEVITAQKIERWRTKAIRLSFAGQYEAAANYFKIAHEHAPEDPQIAYDTGRYLRRRALAVGAMSKQGETDLQRAETYFRLAGRLARAKKNARVLEKVGEAFYEFHQLEAAQQYFELATSIDPIRPRANLGLAGIALHRAQGARAVYAYHQATRGAEAAAAEGLAQFTARKAEYCERLMRDDEFLQAEASWDAVLTQLRWARRGTLGMFLLTWMLQLNSATLPDFLRMVSREVSATALILWVCALLASHIIWALRRN